ncbi:MAG: ATP-binding cassette domain-containing protein [Candidatus Bathyarchaeota archaeon]|nr:ATP-binding cassette domain-containing protein [Candidatus Bathyarchaeota archaeon]
MPEIRTLNLTKIFETRRRGNQASRLRKLFKPVETMETIAVDDMNIEISEGELFGLLGPNGAGKTTTIRMLATVLLPTGGTATVNGYDIVKEPEKVRESIGVLLMGERSVYWKLTGRENLEYFAAMYHIPSRLAKERVKFLLDLVNLSDRADDYVERYSSGMKQRLAIARALIHDPPIIFMDEPTLGLDPNSAQTLRRFIRRLCQEERKTILLTTHYMEEADQLCDRIAILNHGRIIALDKPENLKRNLREEDIVEVEVSNYDERVLADLQRIDGVNQVGCTELEPVALTGKVRIHTKDSAGILSEAIETLKRCGCRVRHVRIVEATLEDVFIARTGKPFKEEDKK